MEIKIAEEISHLSSKQIEELYSKYQDGAKNVDLLKEYNIDVPVNNLFKLFPLIEHKDRLCPFCNLPMYSKRKSKSSTGIPPFQCFSCDHKEYAKNRYGSIHKKCNCEKCTQSQLDQDELREKQAKERIKKVCNPDEYSALPYSSLTFLNKLYLLTLFRMQTEENFDYIRSMDAPGKSIRLSPTPAMDTEIIEKLYKEKIILVDLRSDLSAFTEYENSVSFYPKRVQWIVNISIDGTGRASLKKTFGRLYSDFSDGIQPEWESDIYDFLYRLATEEVLQYIEVKAAELNLPFSAETKSREVVAQLLNDFSVSKIYYFVKKSIENAHIYYSKGISKGKNHAANTIPGKMLELGERALAEKWDTYKYNRDSRSPRSAVSTVFHDLILKGEDDGFHKAPGKLWAEELLPNYFTLAEESKHDVLCTFCSSENIKIKMRNNNLVVECLNCDSFFTYLSE